MEAYAHSLLAQGRHLLETATAVQYAVAALAGLLVSILASNALTSPAGSNVKRRATTPQFAPKDSKGKLSPKDQLLLDMLEPEVHNYVVTDPDLADNPIVYSSAAFCRFTKYDKAEIEGRNCRFLQGAKTDRDDVAKIRSSVAECRDANVNLLNYRKDGSTFINQFFVTPLRSESGKVVYFIGIQHEVATRAPGQGPENVGWVYTVGSHE